MTRFFPVLLVAACLLAPAEAQQAKRTERDPLKSMGRRLKTELGLDAQQQQTFDRLIAEARKDTRRDSEATLRVLRGAHQAARKGEDTARFSSELQELIAPPQLSILNQLESSLRDNQITKLREVRKRFDPSSNLNPSGVLEAFAMTRADMQLDSKQTDAYDTIAMNLAQGLQPGVKTKQLSQDQLDEVLAALQEAMEAGNEAAIPEIGKRILADQKDRGTALCDAILDINAQANDQQRGQLVKMIERLQGERAMQRDGTTPQLLTRAARRCQLNAEQQRKLKEVEKTINPAEMRRDPSIRATTIYKVRTAVEGMLDEQQMKIYRRELTNPAERAKNRAGKGPGGRKAEEASEAKAEAAETPDKP